MEKDVVVISREWHNPNIRMVVNPKGINISMSVDDFIMALAEEVGSPTMILTRVAFLKKLQASSFTVLDGMKRESKKVM